MNFLREQTSRILQLVNFPASNKVNRPFQKKNNGKDRLAPFPPSQHDHADGNMGMKALDVPDVSYSEIEERSKRKTACVTKRKTAGDPHDFGKPIAQSSPVQDHKHSNSDTTRRCFILEDFIVKGTRSGKKKGTGAQGQMLQPSGSRESKSRKRINPTRLGTEESKGGDVRFGLASRLCEPSAPFCEQSIETSNSKNFDEERILLRKERLRQMCDNKHVTHSATEVVTSYVNEFVVAKPHLVSCQEELQVLADIYSRLMDCNLVLNIMTELYFVAGLLVVRVPVGCETDELHPSQEVSSEEATHHLYRGAWNMKKCAYFTTVHNCVYFATSLLNRQRHILELFDKTTLRMIADNRYILAFMPDLYDFISEFLTSDMSKTRRCAPVVAGIQANVSFQSDTDNRHNFPTDQAFHIFRKQRDGFYDILRKWEADHMLPDWSFANALGSRIKTLLNLHSEPANFVHFARLFRSQLLGTCSGYSSCSEQTAFNDNGGESLSILKDVHPEKLSRLHERLVNPVQSGGPCPLPSFPGHQEFYHDFILHSSNPAFLQHLADSLASQILALNETTFVASDLEDKDTSVDDTTRSNYLTCVSALRLLAKFLGLVTFLPYRSRVKVLPEDIVGSQSAVRAKLCPQLEVLGCIKEAKQSHKLVLTLPWVVKYLSMMDPVSAHLPYYSAVFEQLFGVYQNMHLSGRASLLIRLVLGWLFQSSNILEGLFYAWKQDPSISKTLHTGEPTQLVPLDALDIVDEHCLYLCCPYMGELKLCLSVGMGSSCRTVKHITPVSASLDTPSAAKQIQLQLEESFFHGQPASTRKTVEYVAERVASSCVKHICSTLLQSVRKQGAKHVSQLISTSTVLSTMNSESETSMKQLKELLLTEVASIADRCCGDFRHQCDVREYCRKRCKVALPVLLAGDVLEPVCTMCAQIAARFSQEHVNTWIQSHITPGLFLKEFELDIEKAFRNVGKLESKKESMCKTSHVVYSGVRNVKHLDDIESPAHAIMQIQNMIWGLLDGDTCVVTEQQVWVTLDVVQGALCNRSDLVPSAERLLPSLVLDLALLLVARYPDMMTTGLMEQFVSVWRVCEECDALLHVLCPRNMLLLSQSRHAAGKVWTCLAGLLAHLLSCGVLLPDSLEQQCMELLQSSWPQQDGATARTAMRVLWERFPRRLISLRGDLQWPARSPDIAPCDCFLWGYLKSLVYTDRPRTLAQLKENIRQAIANLPIAMLERVDRHFRIQANQCIANGGCHLLATIFKTE
ncbi:codanin-1 isoform X3 [Cryptotermes secundus]|nr:codanin-1 isoform X3 [Cryptotermes secundus]